MTAVAAPAPARSILDGLRRIPLRPVEGWLTLLATATMVAAFAQSLVEAGWTPGRPGDADFLPWAGMAGLAIGVGGAKIGWGRWRTHLVGALLAGLVLPLIVGGIILGPGVGWDPHGLAERFLAMANVARHVWTDLVVENLPYTSQSAHYHLVFGVLVWGAGMLAGFTVFGHRRPLDAVVVLGLAILANMALTTRPQLHLMVIFSAGALLVLIRTHVFEEEVTWARRKIGDPAAVGHLYIQGGAMFVIAAILGSILLTFAASSAPLQGLWQDLPHSLQDVSRWLQKFAPSGGDSRPLGLVGFGDNWTSQGIFQPSDAVAFRAQIVTGVDQSWKWRAGTYTTYTKFGWSWGTTRAEQTPARDVLLGSDVGGDAPTVGDRREVTFRVIPAAFRDPWVIGPNTLFSVDRPTNALVVGSNGWFTTVESTDSLDSYNVTARIPVKQDVAGGLTQERLRVAGTDYPPDLLALYGKDSLPDGSLGPKALKLLSDIKAQVKVPPSADPANPFDLARTMQDYLRSDANFTYDTDIRQERAASCPADISTVECFAIIKRGYCEYYATTMAVLLRASGVPARIAYGFLPGDRGPDGLEVVQARLSHWWVEVYFPGTGWVEFDPTGGNVGRPQAIPSGAIVPATARPSTPAVTAGTIPTPGSGNQGGGPIQPPSSGIGPFIAIAFILMVGFGALAFAAIRRTPRKPMHPDKAWGSLASLAARFGLGPKASQTVYEYAGALGDAVPGARVELTTIAHAKVEVAYGKRDLGADRLHRIAEAYQRLRYAILGVVVRRALRRGRKRPVGRS